MILFFQVSPVFLSIEQPPVLFDLVLQAGLQVQKHAVLLRKRREAGIDLGNLNLQVCDLGLENSQLWSEAGLSLCQRSIQRGFLLW